MEEKIKKRLLYIIYAIIVCLTITLFVCLGHYNTFREFITRTEQTSFDFRQKALLKYKNNNKQIVVIAVDDESYEYIMDKFGSWPIKRQIWANIINGLEKINPKSIVFDMLFLKPTVDIKGDNELAKAIDNNKNVYLSMNFDNTSSEVRTPIKLDKKNRLNLYGELSDNSYITFSNVRPVMNILSERTNKIGTINVTRDEDGVIRYATPIFKYQGYYYPNLSLLVALDFFNKDKISIINNSIVVDENHKIPLDSTNRAILNWYGKSQTYTYYSLWQVINAINNNDLQYLKDNFENKIIYIGTTVTSLSDIKTVPVESNLAGVELHCTFLNNIIDNNFIKRVSIKVDFLISILLSLIVGYFVLRTHSVFKTIMFLLITLASYALATIFLMGKYNIWLSLTIPYITTIATFIFVYCEKYLLKAKDYEQTYKLAVTDGLTQLYNHRYFQEQMIVQLNNYKRYKTPFSLIMIDIDFFKKFNDTYGHQSGDVVLKQVASILKKNSRTSDVACRYGGEEMTIILTNTDSEPAVFMANKICQMVRQTPFILVNGEKVNVTISAGVATVNENVEKTQELIEYCDKCLYKAKENGRNQVVSEI